MAEGKLNEKKVLIWLLAGILLFLAFEVATNMVAGKAVIKAGQPTLIQFYSDNCIVCVAMQPVMDDLIKACDGKGIAIEQMNVSDPEIGRMARRLGVRGVPTFIFFNEKGREYKRLIGIQSKDTMRKEINKLTGNRCSDYSTDS